MKVNIEAGKTPGLWHHKETTDLHLRHYANDAFQTNTGELWVPGSPYGGQFTSPNAYFRTEALLNGREFNWVDFETDSTEDSPTNPNARYSTYVFSRKKMLFPLLLGYGVPAVYDPELLLVATHTFDSLQLHRDAHPLSRVPEGRYDIGQVEYLINRQLALLRYASILQAGIAFGTFPPVDPLAPIHVSATDPRWSALVAGVGLLAAGGQGNLVDGTATVLSDLVDSESVIAAFSMDANVTGVLRGVNVVDGESFVIESSFEGDQGKVGWFLYNS